VTPSEQRLYEELSAMTGATRIEPSDPGTLLCMSALTGETAATLDDYIACYGDEPTDDAEEREVEEVEQRLYEELSEMTGVPMRPTGEARALDVERSVGSLDVAVALGSPFHDRARGVHVVPRSLVEQIDRTYAEVSRHGFLTEAAREEWLYQEFSALLGVTRGEA